MKEPLLGLKTLMAAVTDNILIPLPELALPRDFAWRVRFISTVDQQLRRLRSSGHFQAPRFYGYFFQGKRPVGVSGNWIVTLDPMQQLTSLARSVERMTHGQFSISSDTYEKVPDFILIHDTHDGACWLWRFSFGLRFVEAVEPTSTNGTFTGDPLA